MNEGWIKLHRSLTSWEWYDDHNTKIIFLHLLLNASHKPMRYRGQVYPPGSQKMGTFRLAEETGLTRQQVRTALAKLESTGEITNESTNQFTIITICKWESYQGNIEGYQPTNQPTDNQPITNEQPTDNQRITTLQECKNERKENVRREREPRENPEIPELDQVKTFANLQMIPDHIAESYFHARESVGWVKQGNPIINWKMDFVNYKRIYQERENKNGSGVNIETRRDSILKSIGKH